MKTKSPQKVHKFELEEYWWTTYEEIALLILFGNKVLSIHRDMSEEYPITYIILLETNCYENTPKEEWPGSLLDRYIDKQKVSLAKIGYKDLEGDGNTHDFVKIDKKEADEIVLRVKNKYKN